MISLALLLLTSEVPVDKAAHFGVSFTINTVSYAVCKELISDDKNACLIAAMAGTLAVGLTKEVMDGGKNTGEQHAMDMLANTAGVALSALTIKISF